MMKSSSLHKLGIAHTQQPSHIEIDHASLVKNLPPLNTSISLRNLRNSMISPAANQSSMISMKTHSSVMKRSQPPPPLAVPFDVHYEMPTELKQIKQTYCIKDKNATPLGS